IPISPQANAVGVDTVTDIARPQTLLEVRGLSVEFPGVKALEKVDFTLNRGEIVALLGENGAGKSTLIKALTGVNRRSAGTVHLNGQAIDPVNTAHAQALGIGTVYQEVNLAEYFCRRQSVYR